MSMSTQSGISMSFDAVDAIVATLPGQAYAAKANCVNSKLKSMTIVATERDWRDSFIRDLLVISDVKHN
jgi:hypothetical protein